MKVRRDPRLRCPEDNTILRPFIPDNLPDDWDSYYQRTCYYCPKCRGDLTLHTAEFATHLRLQRERAQA